MVKYFKTETNNSFTELSELEKHCWIDLVNPTDEEIENIVEQIGIPEEMLKAALDEEETARCESEDGFVMFIADIPMMEETDDWYVYTTLPMAIIYNNSYIVTVSLKENSVIKDLVSGRVKGANCALPKKFLLACMNRTASRYLQYLRQIDKTSLRVQAELHRSMKNKELIQLLDLENSLVYFSTSLASNEKMFEKINKIEKIDVNEEYAELYEDLLIENRQAIEMCNIYRDILSSTMDAFASIISNNVNIVMKTLTVITSIITIPTLIASIWGMNVPVPFQHTKHGFWIVITLSIVLSVAGALYFTKSSSRVGYRKRRKK